MAWIARIRSLFRRDKVTQDLDEELDFHLSMREQWNAQQGMKGDEAKRDARVRFGNSGALRDRMSEIDFMLLPQTILQDLRYGARLLWARPGFTLAAVFALALGIGVNTVVFTAYKGFFLRSLDARDPSTMTNLSLKTPSGQLISWFSYLDYTFYRDHLQSFSGVIAAAPTPTLTLTGAEKFGGKQDAAIATLVGRLGVLPPSTVGNVTETAVAFPVSENYFSVLGVTAVRGRTFGALTETELRASPPALISENYWQRRFGGNAAALGSTVRLNGVAFTIIGITPRDFVGTSVVAPDFWIPLTLNDLVHPGAHELSDRENQCCRLFGRLAQGVRARDAQAEMTLLATQLRGLHESHSDLSKPVAAWVWPGSPFPRRMDPELRFAILLIMVAVGMVMVVACANVACLQLARAASRQNELRVRLSLGAGRVRIIRQLLTESALLAVLAGVMALMVSWALMKIAANLAAEALPSEYGAFVIHVSPDLGIFAYVFAISLVAGILFGLAPALESSRAALPYALKADGRTSPIRGGRMRNLLIGAQVAISVVLMIAGCMLIRSSVHALTLDTGYDDKHVVDLELQFPDAAKYSQDRKLAAMLALRARLASLPGVAAVSMGRPPDGGGVRVAAISLDGQKPTERNTRAYIFYTFVEENYFATLGIPLVTGRGFRTQASQPEPAVVLSESAARRIWPGENPIGHSLRMGTDAQFHQNGEAVPDGPVYQVVGVVRDTRGVLLDGSDSEEIYLPMPKDRFADYPVLIRTQAAPALFMASIGPVIVSVDSELGASVISLETMLRQSPAFIVSGLAAFFATAVGLVGLLLASMGIYGTVSYMVVLRNREVGIRMALGARRGDVLQLMLRESIRPVLGGLVLGLVLAVGASFLLRAILYGLGIFDVVSYAGVSGFFLAVAIVASYLPSRRAMKVDPIVALRCE